MITKVMENQQWQVSQDISENGNVTKYKISKNNTVLKFPEIFHLWENSESFHFFYNNILANSNYQDFFWKIKPMDKNWENKDFEFVLVNSIRLTRISADTRPKYYQYQPYKIIN